jgi:hypothetical protein
VVDVRDNYLVAPNAGADVGAGLPAVCRRRAHPDPAPVVEASKLLLRGQPPSVTVGDFMLGVADQMEPAPLPASRCWPVRRASNRGWA